MPPVAFPRPQDPRNNPFAQQQQQQQQPRSYPPQQQQPPQQYNPSFPAPRRDDDSHSEIGDHYDMNSSSSRLAGAPAFYDQLGQLPLSSSLLSAITHPSFFLTGDASSSELFPRRYDASVDSHSSVPSISPFADPTLASSEHYPAWSADRQIPMSTEEIEDIFLDLTQKFGFQRDSMRNMVRSFSSLLFSYACSSFTTTSVRLHHAPARLACFTYDP